MESVANDLQSVLKTADRLRQIKDAEASIRPAPGKWSAKETLGHLIDSAANNHQRFVRVQFADGLKMPGLPPAALAHRVSSGDDTQAVTLDWVARDYVNHILPHLAQTLPGIALDG